MKSIDICGDIFYLDEVRRRTYLHRVDGPAIDFKNGNLWYLQKGKLHRDNGPAIVGKNEFIEYWIDGQPATEDEIKNIKRNKWIDKTYEN